MKWFKELRTGQKVLFLIDVVLMIVMIVLGLSGIGDERPYAVGVLIGLVNSFSIVFAKIGFRVGIMLRTDDVKDDVQPSELQYTSWYIGWGSLTLIMIALIIGAIVLR